eukprot:5496781-Prymnesium_polylepis.1
MQRTAETVRTTLCLLLLPAVVASSPSADKITKVFVVFSNHLDVGYTDNRNGSTSGAVVSDYFHKHFPAAIKTGQEARERGRPYRWMTHSWLVAAYRNCNTTKINTRGPLFPSDVACPSPAE